ncbi:MAG TPA: hypothetical protein VK454_00530 [Myxococcaceae bacterium]|nr:hypothetical protein [Myxococcaceae bacterium]
MSPRPSSPPRGYVLLIVLAAVAVLSVVAAFVHSQTENQLIMTTALKGQSVAASRATLAANAYLAQYKVNYPQASLSLLPTFASYTDAVDAGVGATLPDAMTDYSPTYGNPALPLELSAGGGVQWCVDVWRLNRGLNVPPWTVLEVFGFYGYRRSGAVTTCQGMANAGVVVSQVEVQIEQATVNSGAPGSPGPGGGTGAAGGF